MDDELTTQMKERITALMSQRDILMNQIQQNTAQRSRLEVDYHQTCGAIAGLYEFAPDDEATPVTNGAALAAAVEEELVESGN